MPEVVCYSPIYHFPSDKRHASHIDYPGMLIRSINERQPYTATCWIGVLLGSTGRRRSSSILFNRVFPETLIKISATDATDEWGNTHKTERIDSTQLEKVYCI